MNFGASLPLLVWVSCILAADPYANQPRLVTEGGNLVIMAAADKNISLRTSGTGYVNLNSDNMLQVAQMARQASQVVTRFQEEVETNIQTRLRSLTRQVSGPHGLAYKISLLEQTVLSGNSSGFVPTGSISGPSRSAFGIRLNRISTRLRGLEIKVRNLQSLLSVDECLSNPCKNGATCQDIFNGFLCICPFNWQGTLCDQDVNECAELAGTDLGCQNGGTCVNKAGGYECVCPETFFGLHCSLRENDCTRENSARLCGHGLCINQGGNGRGFVCICDQGWTTDSSHSCTVDVDECQAKRYPCSHDPLVQCVNLPGAFHCGFCPPGYTGNGFQCSDINECEMNNGGCALGVSCLNTRGSRRCGPCPPGSTGDGVYCTPVQGGVCAVNNGGCFPTARCFQNAGIVTCRCPEGYVGDGYSSCSPSAVALNPCHPNPCKNGATCVPHGHSYTCVCHPHLTGPDCSIVIFASCQPNPCQNGGNCSMGQDEGVVQVRCSCAQGFEGRFCETISSDCGGMFYQDEGQLQVPSSENAIQVDQNGRLCTWRIRVSSDKVVQLKSLTVTINPIENFNCDKNYLQVEDLSIGRSLPKICKTTDHSSPMTFLTNVLDVKFFTTSWILKNGFKLSWQAVNTSCGGEIQLQSHGTIESPRFPNNYPPNLDCEWKLVAKPGKKIRLMFDTLDLQPSTDCSKDYVKVFDYELKLFTVGNLLAHICNSSALSAPLTTHLPGANVLFHTDASVSGRGFKILYSLLDGCGGVLTGSSGDIFPPLNSADRYLTDQDCEWMIQLPLGDRIKITFNKFDLEDRDPCDDFVEVRDGPSANSPQVGRWCGTNLPPSYTSSANSLTVIFHSDFALGGDGFTIHYETLCGGTITSNSGEIRSPNYPLNYPEERECVFLINTTPSTVILLQFQDFELESLGDNCEFDYLEVHDGDNANATVIGRYCGEVKPDDVLSTYNSLYLIFVTDISYQFRGFLANFSTIDIPCGGILKETTGTFSAPTNEDGYLPSTECKWLISAPPGWAVQLSWLSMHLEYSRDCQMDSVELYENNTVTGNSSLIDKYCGLKIPPSTTSTTNMMTVRFRSDDSVHREGFTAHYILVDKRKVCGGTYRSITGVIESPNFPEDYPDNKECTYLIHVPQGQQIKLTFEKFQLEGASESCNYDSLEIKNGLFETSPLVGKYCGSELPPDVTSLTNGLWLHFSSDRSSTNRGFRATWDATSTGCGGTLTGPTGSITSPNYPQPYARYAECYFKISVSQGSQVRLTIVDLDLEVHSRCALDYIELYDGLDDRSKSLGRFCSSNHPSSILSSSNHMFVKFKSDISFSGHGFHLKYNSECNITLRSRHGVLESPNYPDKYFPGTNCMWMIQAPRGNKLNISFVHFELEDSARPFAPQSQRTPNDCKYDYVQLLEGTRNETPSTTLGRFCGTDLPPTLHSHLDQVYVHFVSDHMLEESGFHLEWAVSGCGGLYLEKPFGTFTSPNYPNGYPTEVECEWSIVAPWDKSIQITVQEMQLEDLSQCNFDYLAIYGGEDDTAPVLLKACHHQTSPVTVTTSGNHAFVRFVSDHSVSGKGFKAQWKYVDSRCGGIFNAPFGQIHSHNYPKNYDNNDDCEWLIQLPSNHLINLTFTDFDVEPSSDEMLTDYVHVYDGKTLDAPLLLNHSGNRLPVPPSVLSSGNSLLVRHKADGSLTAKGFSAQYSIACGARIKARGTGTFSLEDTLSAASPWASDSPLNCTWYIIAEDPADKITLTFTFLDTSPNTENEDSKCSYNYVAVHDGDTTNATVKAQVCGTKVPPMLRSSGSALTVEAVSLSSGRGHLGRFSAMYSTLATACGGGDLTSEEGAFSSPNFPDGYPPNADCVWQLKASVGNQVTLSFISFDLEDSERCNSDYVEVRSGASNGTLQGVFCGSHLPDNITAADSLWVRFRSDSVNNAKGFMAEYSLVHGNDLVGDSGQISSPLYPRHVVQEGEYHWSITVDNNKVIKITFKEFYIDKYSDECYIFLAIFDGPDSDGSSPSLLKACGAALPPTVLSTGNTVSLLLKNDPYLHGTYFLLDWQAVTKDSALLSNASTTEEEESGCNKIIHLSTSKSNNSVTISSPGHPRGYEPKLECSWVLDTSPGFHLEVTFTTIDVEEFDDCEADFVRVYTGVLATETSTELTPEWIPLTPNLCFPNSTGKSYAGSHRLKVYFESDSSIEKTGFSAKVRSVCGGMITEPTGVLDTTALQPDRITGKVSCEWQIKVRSGRTIRFSFSSFNLPKLGEGSCIISYIMFRNGGYQDSPQLGESKYCGDVAPSIPDSGSNRVFISYVASSSAPGVVLRFEEVDFTCNQNIVLDGSLSSQAISTPNYPQSPPTPHITCTWTVTVPVGESVHLDFVNRFDLKPSPECEVEYIEVHDGGTELSPLIGRYCEKTPPPRLTKGNRMYIKYFTDADTPNNGFSAVVKIATCGGTYFDQRSIQLTSPQYPSDYPPDLDCLWRIVGANADHQLIFNVTELLLGDENDEDSAQDYIEFLSVDPITNNITDHPPPTKLFGRHSSQVNGSAFVPPSSSNEMYIRFHSGPRQVYPNRRRFAITIKTNLLKCRHEINAPSGVITTPNYPNPIPRRNHLYCRWDITVPKGRVASLTMKDFDLEPVKEDSWSYHMSFFSGNIYMLAASASSQMIGRRIDSYSNTIRIHYYEESISGAHRGFKAEFSSDKPQLCGGRLENNSSVRFSPAEFNLTFYWCEWTYTQSPLADNRTTFTATIQATLNLNVSKACTHLVTAEDSIEVLSPSSKFNMDRILARICQNTTTPVVVRSPFPTLSIMARKRGPSPLFKNKTSAQSIANISIATKTDSCGGIVHGPDASITSPGFPGSYPPDIDCAWFVEFQPNVKIHVTVEVLDLDADCNKEFLRIYNGDTQREPHLTAPLCGNSLPSPPIVIAQSNVLFLEFHSGPSPASRKGFKLALTQDSTGCGGVLHSANAVIQSPRYGSGDYLDNTECDWTVVLPPGFHAGISFPGRFSLEDSEGCNKDFIKIFDWKDEDWSQIGNNICGRVPPSGIITITNKFRVLFRTNDKITNDGFKLSWTKLCGGIHEVKGEGTIISPNYPNVYPGSLNCNYTLLAPGKTISGRFDDFQIEESVTAESNLCQYDNVTLTTYSLDPHFMLLFLPSRMHPFYGVPKQTVLCGSQLPEPVTSYSKLELVLRTDAFLGLKGLAFTYSVASCGGNIDSPTVISSPNTTHINNCTWYITAPQDKVVVIKIQKLVSYYGLCLNNGLRMYNGHNISDGSSLIETMCSSYYQKKTRIVSSGRNMSVHYYTDTLFPMAFQAAIGFTYGEKHGCGGVIQTADVRLPYTLRSPDVDGDGQYEPLLSCEWLILAPQAHQIRVAFHSFDIQNCTTGDNSCSCDFLEIRDGDSDVRALVDRFCGSSPYPDVISSSGSLLIHFYSDGATQLSGFQLVITTFLSPCGLSVRNATTETQTLQSPTTVSGFQSCLWHLVTPHHGRGMLSIKFTDMRLAQPCSYNYIHLMEKMSVPTPQDGRHAVMDSRSAAGPIKLCGNRVLDLTFNSRSVQVHYVSNQASSHFALEFKMKDCSGNYTAPFGRLVADQNYQSFGYADAACYNLIKAPQSNATISLFFNSFFCLEGSRLREPGKMIVYDGESEQADELATFCSTRRPNPIFSTGPALYIKFLSNRFGKFDITYMTTDKGRGCGGKASDISGMFSSPLFPSPYKADSSCSWDISVPPSNKIYFNFILFDIGEMYSCNTNYIQFLDIDPSTGMESIHSRYCGKEKPAQIQMGGDTARVRYVTTAHNNGTGWLIRWAYQPINWPYT